jgi:hypothetical protein
VSGELAKKLAADLRRTAAVCRIKREALEDAANYSRVNSSPKPTSSHVNPKSQSSSGPCGSFPKGTARDSSRASGPRNS